MLVKTSYKKLVFALDHRLCQKNNVILPNPRTFNHTQRKRIHALLDSIWQSGRIGRRELYQAISDEVGWEYHTAQIRKY